jgi:F0F1-type ATP synthase assembly protein I
MSRDSQREPPEAGSLAFTFVALVLVFTGIGYALDRVLHTLPWLMVAGVFVGAGLGFVYLVYILFTTGSKGRAGKKKIVKRQEDDSDDSDQRSWW